MTVRGMFCAAKEKGITENNLLGKEKYGMVVTVHRQYFAECAAVNEVNSNE